MRIVIGEDSTLLREGLARLLADAGHDVVAKAPDAPSAVAAIRKHQPDLAILDINMPPDRTNDGARAARRHVGEPQLRVLLPVPVGGQLGQAAEALLACAQTFP